MFLVRRSHRSEVATIADGRTVRRLGDGGRSVFLLGIGRRSCSLCLSVCFVIGGHCQLLPVMVAVASVFLLRPSIDTAVMVAALIGGHCRRSVSGCAALIARRFPPLPVSP